MIAPMINLAAIAAMLLLTACADALVYGERTSLSLASVRLNDDPAEPVKVKLGFTRDVVLVAPALGGDVVERDGQGGQRTIASGEAVSQFSTFTVSSKGPFLPDGESGQEAGRPDLLAVQSRFASGEAARAIAGEPEVVAAFLGLLGNPITGEKVAELAVQRQEAMFRAVDAIEGSKARGLAMMPPTAMDTAMQNVLSVVDPNNQRGTNELVARRVLKAWIPELPVSSYAAWESALGMQ